MLHLVAFGLALVGAAGVVSCPSWLGYFAGPISLAWLTDLSGLAARVELVVGLTNWSDCCYWLGLAGRAPELPGLHGLARNHCIALARSYILQKSL